MQTTPVEEEDKAVNGKEVATSENAAPNAEPEDIDQYEASLLQGANTPGKAGRPSREPHPTRAGHHTLSRRAASYP